MTPQENAARFPVWSDDKWKHVDELAMVEAVAAVRDELAKEELNGHKTWDSVWFGLPERWYDSPTWRCMYGHVSKVYLKSEARGGSCCLKCGTFVVLTFPEDVEAES